MSKQPVNDNQIRNQLSILSEQNILLYSTRIKLFDILSRPDLILTLLALSKDDHYTETLKAWERDKLKQYDLARFQKKMELIRYLAALLVLSLILLNKPELIPVVLPSASIAGVVSGIVFTTYKYKNRNKNDDSR